MGSSAEGLDKYRVATLNELVEEARKVRENSGEPPFIIRPGDQKDPGQFIGYDDHALADWLEELGGESAELAQALRQKFAVRSGQLRESKGQLDNRAKELSRDLTEVEALRRRIEPVLNQGNRSMMDPFRDDEGWR